MFWSTSGAYLSCSRAWICKRAPCKRRRRRRLARAPGAMAGCPEGQLPPERQCGAACQEPAATRALRRRGSRAGALCPAGALTLQPLELLVAHVALRQLAHQFVPEDHRAHQLPEAQHPREACATAHLLRFRPKGFHHFALHLSCAAAAGESRHQHPREACTTAHLLLRFRAKGFHYFLALLHLW